MIQDQNGELMSSRPAPGVSVSRGWAMVVRVGIALVLVLMILHWVDFTVVLATISKTEGRYVLLVVALAVFDRYLMAYKWNLLLRARGIGFSNPEVFRIYIASGFVGTFLPTGVGADIFRAIRTTTGGRRIDMMTASIVVERVIGMLAVVVLALVGLGLVVNNTEDSQFRALYYFTWVFFALLLLGLFLSIKNRPFTTIKHYLSRFQTYKPVRLFLNLHGAYVELSRHREILLVCFVLSVCEQGVQSLSLFYSAKAMGLSIPIIYFVAISPLSVLATTLPISISSIGVLEGAYLFLFAMAGLSATESLALSFLTRIIGWILLVPCGLVFLYDSLSLKQLRQSS
jgi:glycosyltransferase 2 family protein